MSTTSIVLRQGREALLLGEVDRGAHAGHRLLAPLGGQGGEFVEADLAPAGDDDRGFRQGVEAGRPGQGPDGLLLPAEFAAPGSSIG
mgnify:CR=1 FL=1